MQLPLVPLDDTILFPGMTATIAADVGDAEQVFLLPRPEGEYGRIGTIAEVVETGRLPGGITAVTLTGLRRGRAGTASPALNGELTIEVEPLEDGVPGGDGIGELERNYRAVVEEILELRGDDGRVAAFLRSISEPGPLADTSGYSPDISLADKQRLLETVDVAERLEQAHEHQRERLAELQVRRRIRDDVESGAQAQQREYFLRKQMESIRKELGEDD
ncbi:MAG: LON peptidase substrate-binding domain-containing protein, partial [Solirubrobacterales bacterium]